MSSRRGGRRSGAARRLIRPGLALFVGLGLLNFSAVRCASPTRIEAVTATDMRSLPERLPITPESWRGKVDYVAFDARIREMMADPSMQGLAVAVVEDGRLSFVQGYGLTATDGGEPVKADTVFRWASLSKTLAGSLVAKLDAEGALSLSDPIAKFDTGLRLPGDAQRTLRLEQLLAQQTGLPRNAFDGRLEDGQDPGSIRRALATAAPMCAPGTCHSYQNVAFDAVSEVIASAAGKSMPSVAEQELFEPLGMTSATMSLDGLRGSARWARPHRNGRAAPLLETYYRVPAAAGVNSNIVDLARWMRAQMGLAPKVLSPDVLMEVQRSRVGTGKPYGNTPFGPALESPGYGLGMRSFIYRGHRLAGHSGAVTGYRSTMMFDPAADTGIVMMWNSEANLPFKLQAEFFDLAYGAPSTDWLQLDNGVRRGALHRKADAARHVR
jgi:beta-lactamase class C